MTCRTTPTSWTSAAMPTAAMGNRWVRSLPKTMHTDTHPTTKTQQHHTHTATPPHTHTHTAAHRHTHRLTQRHTHPAHRIAFVVMYLDRAGLSADRHKQALLRLYL